jgi:hypothetical protein
MLERSHSGRRQAVARVRRAVWAHVLLAWLLLPGVLTAQARWTDADTRRVVDNTRELTLAPDLSGLSPAEHQVVSNLLEAGRIMQDLYEDQLHPDAARVRASLVAGSPQALLYRLFEGPIGTNGQNERAPFVPARPEMPGKNVYPWAMTRAELDAYLAAHPEARASILAPRSVVRRATAENLDGDLGTLAAHPGLLVLHADLQGRLQALRASPSEDVLYAVPYAVAYADRLGRVATLLRASADTVEEEDPDLASYLRLRSLDLQSSNYEGGDAAWVSGRFNHLNAQIGSYETYDDALYGVKAFYSLSLLVRDRERSDQLDAALTDIQSVEDALPYDHHKQVRSHIPVGVYNVVADFGQARGLNTASILPNDADHARKYGRTILLRYNIMTQPQLFEVSRNRFCAAVADKFCDDLTMDGSFQRTLWHEIGHYLGVDHTDDGRTLDQALGSVSNLYEEMKADLVSLFTAARLHDDGFYSDDELRAFYAAGILRVLQGVEPRPDEPYQTMELMQWNWYLEHDVLLFRDGRLSINYDRYHDAVEAMLREVLAIQSAGDVERAQAFIDRWTRWDPNLHGVIARAVGSAPGGGYYLVKYAALDG